MKFIRITLLLMIVYFLLPISIRALSEYDMQLILKGESPAFCLRSNEKFGKMGKVYNGFFYRIVEVRKQIDTNDIEKNSVIVGPMLTYHVFIRKLYFWTGQFFYEMQSLRIISEDTKSLIIV